MPNHLEGIKCQQAEEGKKIVCYFLMVLLLHWSFCCCCSFFLQLEKKKRFWNSSFYNIVFCPLLLTGGGRSFLKLFPKRTVFFDLIPVTPSLVLLSLPPNALVYRLSSSGNVAASMSYPESNSAEYRSSSAADSDGALLSRIEPPLLDISLGPSSLGGWGFLTGSRILQSVPAQVKSQMQVASLLHTPWPEQTLPLESSGQLLIFRAWICRHFRSKHIIEGPHGVPSST